MYILHPCSHELSPFSVIIILSYSIVNTDRISINMVDKFIRMLLKTLPFYTFHNNYYGFIGEHYLIIY